MDMDEDVTLAGETEFLGADVEDDAELAWSAEEYVVVDPDHGRRHWASWIALVTVLCAVAGAAVWLGTVFYQQESHRAGNASVEAPKTAPSIPPPAEAAAPQPLPDPGPPIAHQQPPAPVAAPAPQPTSPDDIYLTLLNRGGISVHDVSSAEEDGHEICSYMANHSVAATIDEMYNAAIKKGLSINYAGARVIVQSAVTAYCPDMARR